MKLYAAALLVLLPCLAAIPEIDKAKTLGNPTAPVRIEIFSDFTCPHCRVLHETTLPLLMRDYVVPGKVCIVDRAFPLTGAGHEHSREAFSYAVAAARIGKYQKVADALFAAQQTITFTGNVEGVADSVLTPTEQKTVKSLLKSPEVQKQIETDIEEGKAMPVPSTPTLWVTAHGHSDIVKGPINYDLLKQYLDALLKK